MWLPCFFDDSVVTGEIPNSLRVIPDLTILTLLLQLFLEVVLTDQVIFFGSDTTRTGFGISPGHYGIIEKQNYNRTRTSEGRDDDGQLRGRV